MIIESKEKVIVLTPHKGLIEIWIKKEKRSDKWKLMIGEVSSEWCSKIQTYDSYKDAASAKDDIVSGLMHDEGYIDV